MICHRQHPVPQNLPWALRLSKTQTKYFVLNPQSVITTFVTNSLKSFLISVGLHKYERCVTNRYSRIRRSKNTQAEVKSLTEHHIRDEASGCSRFTCRCSSHCRFRCLVRSPTPSQTQKEWRRVMGHRQWRGHVHVQKWCQSDGHWWHQST